jgi:hypothetical protein
MLRSMAASERAAASAGPGPGGSRGLNLLLADMRVTYLVLNEFRYRALDHLFGSKREQANLLTLVAASLVARGMHDRTATAARVVKPRRLPTPLEAVLLVAGAQGLLEEMLGETATDEVPGAAALLAVALLGRFLTPVPARMLHRFETLSSQMTTGFHHRYGYLVDPGHWRERRARRRSAVT